MKSKICPHQRTYDSKESARIAARKRAGLSIQFCPKCMRFWLRDDHRVR